MAKDQTYLKLLREQLVGAVFQVELWEEGKSVGANGIYATMASEDALAKCRQRVTDLEIQISVHEAEAHTQRS